MTGDPAQNVYLEKDAARRFADAISYSSDAVAQIADKVVEAMPWAAGHNVSILDVGAGPGVFTLPFMRRLVELGQNPAVVALDISPRMLGSLNQRLRQPEYSDLQGRFDLWQHDADNGLTPRVGTGSVDIVILTFVLHYLKDVPRLLNDVARVIRQGGLLIQGEITGDLRYVDGTFSPEIADPEPHWQDFWRQYFTIRDDISLWRCDLRVTNLTSVFQHLEELGAFEAPMHCDVSWCSSLNYRDLLDWIRYGFLSSLGSALTPNDRDRLSARMRQWCDARSVDLEVRFEVPWGIRAFWSRRR